MLKLDNICFKNIDKILFNNLSASLYSKDSKTIALLGENGAGKSTLLKIILGEIKPDKGEVLINNEVIGYIPQDIVFYESYEYVGEYLESKLAEDWHGYLIDIVLNQLNLEEDFIYKKMDYLSGGEKVKVKLAECLLLEPSIILFDETTNHLDNESLQWLGKFMKRFLGSSIIITHDRDFINNYINHIWEINPTTQKLDFIKGHYDDFLRFKENKYEHDKEVYDRYINDIKKVKLWLKENEFHPKYRFSSIVMSKKKVLKSLVDNQIKEPYKFKELKIKAKSNINDEVNGRLLKVNIKEYKKEEKVLFNNLTFSIRKGDIIHVIGKNGSGKTSLFRDIVSAYCQQENMFSQYIKPYLGKKEIFSDKVRDTANEFIFSDNISIAYLPQFSSLNSQKNVLDEFIYRTGLDETKVRSILAKYNFIKSDVFRLIGSFSYGEQKRLELAMILALKPHLLLLDEPTNHLDIYAREQIEKYLLDINVSMIFISHDQYFINKMKVNKIVNI